MDTIQADIETLNRFWSKVEITDSCWIWKAGINKGGYGNFEINGKIVSAHRYAYAIANNGIYNNLEIDHLCKNRKCVNPSHLDLVPHIINVNRGDNGNRMKTHCPKGHEYNNIKLDGSRQCLTCANETAKRYRESHFRLKL